ncbi:aldehyde oxidase [Bifidobacterium lemurum]|uniref:Aldehyde oxidase n=1 Tax=Bifidobacterium lemurum TaxID=1603886 RepID=A0A261FVX5_9BIFI|nr:aldo/keto reductase [Bifidobacterium lemurum]OZG63329.1 aldehyde oxidase [Bifidobacterium lemurum]QOL34244.1 aldo/keto reductase [Bifidobacterium lemurum]
MGEGNTQHRVLGGSAIEVSPLGLGCMGFTHGYGAPMDQDQAVHVLHEAYEMGYTFFDTAESYTGIDADGRTAYNEELVGEAIRDMGDDVVVATKFGITIASDRTLTTDSSPDTIRRSVEGSLKRLGVDTIDLYYQHRIDPKTSPETVADIMGELIREGKIRAWGISEADEEYLRRAHAVCPVAAVQNRYSMMARWHESLFETLEELNVALVAFSPMANGFLTNGYDASTTFSDAADYRAAMPQFGKEGRRKAQGLTELVARLAHDKQATAAQISLAWMLCKKPWIIPIPGSRKPARLRENFAASQVTLTADEIYTIDETLDHMDLDVFGGSRIRENS